MIRILKVQNLPNKIYLPPSRLDILRDSLEADDRVFIAGDPILGVEPGWAQTAILVVCPKEPILDENGKRLNEFMNSLCPNGMNFDLRDQTRGWSESRALDVPKLYFDDVIGQANRTIVETVQVFDQRAMSLAGKSGGVNQYTRVEKYKRRTWLYVYPDMISASEAYIQHQNGGSDSYDMRIMYSIPPEVMERLRSHYQSPKECISHATKSITG